MKKPQLLAELSLLPIFWDSCDWKEEPKFKKALKFAAEASQDTGKFYQVEMIDVWTGDEQIWLAAPPEVFKWLKEKNQCGMELFMDAGTIGDEVTVDAWYWSRLEQRIWVIYKFKGQYHLMPMDEWDLLSENYPWK